MTERRQQFARVTAALLGLTVLAFAGYARAQGAVRDQSGGLTVRPTGTDGKSWMQQRFAGSFVDLATYVGSGTFYSSAYRNPYVSNALYLRPTFVLGTKYNLTLNARIYLEEEYTTPDTLNGRRFYPLDSWLFLTAKNLYTMPKAKVRFTGTARVVLPTSWESRYAHLVAGVGVGVGATRVFEFGQPNAQGKRWMFTASLAQSFTKSLRTSMIRGNAPGDTTGCRETGPAGFAGGGGAADTDRCGGPLNSSFAFNTAGTVALSRGRWTLGTTLIVINDFRYSVDPSIWGPALGTLGTIPRGRNDWTWGIVSIGYEVTEHFSVTMGVASYQPALDSRYQNLRFPFFDFAGPNANNFTQAFLSLTGTL